MRRVVFARLLAGSLVLVLAAAVSAGDKNPTAAPRLDLLKKLAGEWVGVEGDGGSPITVTYKVTAAGSAVVETLFPGMPHEMVTVYHQDGKDLVLTHYCAAGNQPHLRAELGADGRTLVFKFVSCTNMKSPNDMHMHEGRLTIADEDHIQSEWTGYVNGKPGHKARFNLTRKK